MCRNGKMDDAVRLCQLAILDPERHRLAAVATRRAHESVAPERRRDAEGIPDADCLIGSSGSVDPKP